MTSLAGEFFLNLLEQDRVWVTRDGRRLVLEEMEWSHRRNVLAMLERQLSVLYREWLTEFLDEGVAFDKLARLGWVMEDPLTGRYRPAGARAWFDRQPLVMRLQALLEPAASGSP